MNLADLILIVLFLLIVWEGYARGFLVSVMYIARVAIGMPLSYAIAKNLSEPLYNSLFRATFNDSLVSSLESSGLESVINSVRDSVGNLPESLGGNVDLSFLSKLNAGTAVQSIMENVVDPIALVVCKMLLFVLVLVVFSFLYTVLLTVIRKAVKGKTVLKKTNKFLGAVLGAAKAIIVVFGLAAVAQFFITYFSAGNSGLISQLEGSALIELINKFNPLLII